MASGWTPPTVGSVSSALSFQWMGGAFGQIIDAFVAVWLADAMRDLEANVRKYLRKKSVRVSSTMFGSNVGVLTISDSKPSGPFSLSQWAFGEKVNIPRGGFKPSKKSKAFLIQKPWGETVFRSRVYNKHGGGFIDLSKVGGGGFVTKGIAETFTEARLEVLASGLATLTAAAVINEIKRMCAARGILVVTV